MSDKVQLNISGMTCATCVRRVEEGLRETPGVISATVNFATEKAHVEYDKNITDVDALQNKVRDLGYEAFVDPAGHNQGKITISVGGMTCAACVRRVENALKEVEGVVEVSVNLATARATVIHASHWAGLPALARAVTEHGYEFLGELKDSFDDPMEKARTRELKELTLKVICGAILSVIIFFGSMQHWFGFLHFIPRQTMLDCNVCADRARRVLGREPFFYRRLQSRKAKNIRYEYAGRCRRFFGLCLFSGSHFFPAFL